MLVAERGDCNHNSYAASSGDFVPVEPGTGCADVANNGRARRRPVAAAGGTFLGLLLAVPGYQFATLTIDHVVDSRGGPRVAVDLAQGAAVYGAELTYDPPQSREMTERVRGYFA